MVNAAIARFGSSSERFDWGVLVSPLLLAERQTWNHSPTEVYVIPGQLAQLARAQAESYRHDEQRLEPAVGFVAVV
jgi:hypothetical protein